MLTALMPAPLNAMVTATCTTAGSVSPFLFRRLGRLPARTGEVEGPKETTGLLSALKSLLTVDWLFLLGLLVCLFISVADEQGDATATAFQPELVGCITASVAAVVLCLAHGHTPLSLLIGRLVIPCLVAFLVLMSGFPEGSSLFSFSAFIVYAPYMLLSLFALASLAATSSSGELPPAFVYGVALALCTVVLLLGFICHHTIASQTDLRIMLRSRISLHCEEPLHYRQHRPHPHPQHLSEAGPVVPRRAARAVQSQQLNFRPHSFPAKSHDECCAVTVHADDNIIVGVGRILRQRAGTPRCPPQA